MPFKVNLSPTHNGKRHISRWTIITQLYVLRTQCLKRPHSYIPVQPTKSLLLLLVNESDNTNCTNCAVPGVHIHTEFFLKTSLKRCWGRSVTYICVIGSSKFPSITILHIGYNGCICLNIQGSTCYRLKKQPKDIQPRTSSTTNIILAKLSSRLLCLSGWQRWVLAKLLGL